MMLWYVFLLLLAPTPSPSISSYRLIEWQEYNSTVGGIEEGERKYLLFHFHGKGTYKVWDVSGASSTNKQSPHTGRYTYTPSRLTLIQDARIYSPWNRYEFNITNPKDTIREGSCWRPWGAGVVIRIHPITINKDRDF